MQERFDRNERFFGKEGQGLIRSATVAVVGIGGLGTHVVQQLSYLGVGKLILIDGEELDKTNKNRYIGSYYDDPISGLPKVDIGERISRFIDPAIHVEKVFNTLFTKQAFEAIIRADYVFGCLDNDGSRFVLNELCAAYSRPYFDLASDIHQGCYGGRVCVSWDGDGCLYCMDALDLKEVQNDIESPGMRAERDAIYGVNSTHLAETGPSVVSINGVVASIAVTEFMVGVTGIRKPYRYINYYGHLGNAAYNKEKPQADCFYCHNTRKTEMKAAVERYLKLFER